MVRITKGKDGKPALLNMSFLKVHDLARVGDVNGDGRADIIRPKVVRRPKDLRTEMWKAHPWLWGTKRGTSRAHPQIHVYDVNGDG